MGSLNDYGQYRAAEEPRRGSWKKRLLGQTVISLALVITVAATITGDNLVGSWSRYVVGEGLDASGSWIPLSGQVTAAEADDSHSDSMSKDAASALLQSEEEPVFTAPASGVAETASTVEVGGFTAERGLLIQGAAGQKVKAAASGQVSYLGQNESGYLVELTHSAGFRSRYQGLSEINVGAGDLLSLGDSLGATATGELTFSLFKGEEEVDPLDYLFD